MKLKRLWLMLSVLCWLVLWQVASVIVGHDILLVSPVKAFLTLIRMLGELSFYRSIFGSLIRIMAGFAIAFFAGTLLAYSAHFLMPVRMLLAPVMAAIKATPVASFVILALIWISSRNLSILMAILIVLPVIYLNVLDGLDRTDHGLIEMAKVFELSYARRIRAIYMPAALPSLLTAVRLSLGMCWKAGIAAEVIAQPRNSIGSALYQAKILLSTPELFAWTLAIIFISVLLEKLTILAIDHAGRRFEDGN